MYNNEKLEFKDINLNAYHAVSGFENEQSIRYTRLLKYVMESYDNIESLNCLDKSKVKNVNKNEYLVGAREFLEHKWLETIHLYSTNKDKNGAGIIDGTDHFFGQLFDILEFRPILDWLYSLNNEYGSLQLNFKKAEAILIKLFIRGKTCDDICRGSYISKDFTYLFKQLDDLSKTLDYFDYWIEDDRGKTNWNAIKIYLVRTKKNLYGKFMAFELQLITPEMFIIKNQSTNHVNYERMRLARDDNVLKLYEELKLDFHVMCSRLKLNGTMCNLMDIVLNLGNFMEVKGQFINNNSHNNHAFSLKHKKSNVFLDELENDLLIIESYKRSPETKFQFLNGKMVCIGSCNHYLTKQRIKICPMIIKIKFIGEDIMIQYSPSADCGWGGKEKGQTVNFFGGNSLWIRNKIYTISETVPQVYFNNDIPYLDKNKYIHEMEIKLDKNVTNYKIDGKHILHKVRLEGAEILDQGFFHLGFCCWSEKPVTTIVNVEIEEL